MKPADVVRCIDLTSLSGQEDESEMVRLCQDAVTPLGSVAAICVYPQYLEILRAHRPAGVKLATVINFPLGQGKLEEVIKEVQSALALGAEELEVVLPYEDILQGEFHTSVELIEAIKKVAGRQVVKVILETGILQDSRLIFRVSEILLDHGADFLKTSTGKREGATEEAVAAMLKALWQCAQKQGKVRGLKISGGIKTFSQAQLYMEMGRAYFGEDYLVPQTFRIGASSLLQEVLSFS